MIKTTKSLTIRVLTMLILCLFLLPSSLVKAETTTTTYVDDTADLFSDSEESTLTSKIIELKAKYNMDIVILTVPDRGYQSATGFINDYVDERCDKKELSEDLVIAFRDVNDRWLEIRGYEKAETYITENRANAIIDEMTDDIRQDHYYDGFLIFLDEVDTYLGVNPNPLTWTWVQLLIGLAIGGIITAVMVSHSSGKVTTTNRTYLDTQHSGIVAKRDTYLNTTVRRVKIESSSSSSGHSGGHSVSSGGRSSSGAGRRV